MYTLAAEQGEALAQSELGVLFANGQACRMTTFVPICGSICQLLKVMKRHFKIVSGLPREGARSDRRSSEIST